MSQDAAQALEAVGAATWEGPEKQASTLIGATLDGSYRITRLIAEGGMSAVYEALQLRLNQRVAVKVMARELASNPEALARFRREAEITSRLRHPHLVAVTDFGTALAGQPYLVMEYLEGIDLDHRIHRFGRLPLRTAVHITKQVSSALAAAHEQGVVHRDLKPANVFLLQLPGEPDFAKILDFGISKVRAANTQLTKASSIIGTPNYMSPEQATGMLDEIDHRTDQWALACIVWEMLLGRGPFASDDMSAVFYQVIHLAPRPLAKRVPGLPDAVEAVLRRALSKDMTERFPSIRDFASALEDAAHEQPGEGPSSARAPRTASATSEPPQGGAWVERRQARQERRKSDASPPPVRVTGKLADDLEAPSGSAPFWRKIKPIHLLSVLTGAMAMTLLVLLRWNGPATAAPPPATIAAPHGAIGPLVATPTKQTPSVTAPSPTSAERAFAAAPTAVPKPKKPSASATTARGVPRTSKQKQAVAAAWLRDASDPFESPRRSLKERSAKPQRHPGALDDSTDPFAPTRQAGKRRMPQSPRGDSNLADPFAP